MQVFIGSNFSDDMPSTLLKWAVCLKTGEDLNHEYRIRSAAGEFKWFFVKAVALRGEDGIHTAWSVYAPSRFLHQGVR